MHHSNDWAGLFHKVKILHRMPFSIVNSLIKYAASFRKLVVWTVHIFCCTPHSERPKAVQLSCLAVAGELSVSQRMALSWQNLICDDSEVPPVYVERADAAYCRWLCLFKRNLRQCYLGMSGRRPALASVSGSHMTLTFANSSHEWIFPTLENSHCWMPYTLVRKSVTCHVSLMYINRKEFSKSFPP